MNLVLVSLLFISKADHYSDILFRSSCMQSVISVQMRWLILQSSAKSLIEEVVWWVRSFMYTRKSNEPRTFPDGTPNFTVVRGEVTLPIVTA